MTPLQLTVLGIIAVVVLIVAYKIGKVLLRLAVGLAVLAGIGYCVWRFMIHP